jgi:hypothetical protein
MKKKTRKPASTVRERCRQERAEKKAIKVFNAELQKAIDVVDWGNVKLPRQSC